MKICSHGDCFEIAHAQWENGEPLCEDHYLIRARSRQARQRPASTMIIYAPNYSPCRFKHITGSHYPVVVSDGDHLRGIWITDRNEEYWRAFMVTGMTRQVDPFFADRSTLRHYGRRP